MRRAVATRLAIHIRRRLRIMLHYCLKFSIFG